MADFETVHKAHFLRWLSLNSSHTHQALHSSLGGPTRDGCDAQLGQRLCLISAVARGYFLLPTSSCSVFVESIQDTEETLCRAETSGSHCCCRCAVVVIAAAEGDDFFGKIGTTFCALVLRGRWRLPISINMNDTNQYCGTID